MSRCRHFLVLFVIGSNCVTIAKSVDGLRFLTHVGLASLTEFRTPGANWTIAGSLGGDPRNDTMLVPNPGFGILVNRPTATAKEHLFTKWEHGDIELDLDFLVSAGSNSGVYFQGRYEIQICDSWNRPVHTSHDTGAIYQRWDPSRQGEMGFEGHAPLVTVDRAPGLWQHLRVIFRAPHFDGHGAKIAPARFERVELNGVLVHENVEVFGPTRAAAFMDEAPFGPVMLQGDHGCVAYRNISYQRIDPEKVTLSDLQFKAATGDFKILGEERVLDAVPFVPADRVSSALGGASKGFVMVITGSLHAPTTGDYAFSVSGSGLARLTIDGGEVLYVSNWSETGRISLAQGDHGFRIAFLHREFGPPPMLEWKVAGPGLDLQTLSAKDSAFRTEDRPSVLIEATDRPRIESGVISLGSKQEFATVCVGDGDAGSEPGRVLVRMVG